MEDDMTEKKVGFTRRYSIFFIVGIAVEAIRLVSFWLFAKMIVAEFANLASLVINIIATLVLHGGITWRDRPGSWQGKFARIVASKPLVYLAKAGLFPIWIRIPILSCPFYDLTHTIVDLAASLFHPLGGLNSLFTCDWMSLALMDLVIAMTVGFLTNDKFAFWERAKK